MSPIHNFMLPGSQPRHHVCPDERPNSLISSCWYNICESNSWLGLAYFVSFLVGVTNFGCANAAMFCLPWANVSAARNGHSPMILLTIHKNRRVPVPAILLTTIITLLLYLPDASTLLTFINYFQFSVWTITGPLSLHWLSFV